MKSQFLCREAINALGVHICQRASYEWFARVIGEAGFAGKRVFDFGPGGYPLAVLLCKWGAEYWWMDRSPAAVEGMKKLARVHGLTLHEATDKPGVLFDIVIASNAAQHNKDDGAPILMGLRKLLKPGATLLLSEKLGHGQSQWLAGRPDPCWARTLDDHKALWAQAGMTVGRADNEAAIAFLWYSFAPHVEDEEAYWTSAEKASQVVVALRAVE